MANFFDLADFEEEFCFYWGVQGEGVGAYGGSGVAAWFAEDLLEELAGAVGYFGMVGERRVGLDEDADADDADEAGEVAVELGIDDGECVDDALGGGFLGEFEGDGGGDFSFGDEFAGKEGELAADEHEVAGGDGGEVGADGLGELGEGDVEFS